MGFLLFNFHFLNRGIQDWIFKIKFKSFSKTECQDLQKVKLKVEMN